MMREYIKRIRNNQLFFPKDETISRKEYIRQNAAKGLKYGAFLLASFAVLRGALVTVKANIPANNTVNGRELPIYCVETQEKKIALSFDAAWGNEDTARILEILKKHGVHVTFFMTGGWVDK